MKLIIVRHGEPDYAHDTLTPKGWREAELLSELMARRPAEAYYVSPLGRAADTASATLKRLGREGVTLDWLREFTGKVHKPNKPEVESVAWDWLPGDWTRDERFFSRSHWHENEVMQAGGIKEKYDEVIRHFDELLETHGYAREGACYRAVKANNDTIVFFCHFALECVLLSHLLNISPMLLWHGTCALPTSVTTVVTEERREGLAYFRMLGFGEVAHLTMNGEEPSFAARFCEKYGNPNERMD